MSTFNLVGFLPLVVALLLAALVPLSTTYRRIDTLLTKFARQYFGRYVGAEAPERTRRLRAAYVAETYRSYAAKTYLVTVLLALVGVTIGVYLFGGILLLLPAIGDFINQLPSTMANALGRPELEPELSPREVFAVVTAGGVVSGLVVGATTYWYRWEAPRSHAEVRRRGINEGLPRTIAFIYALSRGGMSIPEVMRTLAHNREVYGHGADEISVAVREMDLFGSDIISAVRRMTERTPSEDFKTFGENLASVLQSGQDLPAFLREQYETHRDQARERQDEILELLATIAEAYVTVLVAGTLFLMTILLVFGLTTSPTINFLRLLAYLLIPLGNLLFMVYLDGKLDLLGVARGSDVGALKAEIADKHSNVDDLRRIRNIDQSPVPTEAQHVTGALESGPAAVSDGGAYPGSGATDSPDRTSGQRPSQKAVDEKRRRLDLYDSVAWLKGILSNPLQTVLRTPTTLLYATVPLAIVWVAIRVPNVVAAGGIQARILDDILIQAALFVFGTFAVVWEVYSRRIRRMEAQLPELVSRLASLNQAGMSVVESIDRVRESDLGELSVEVDRIWRDVQYGATVDDAFRRFGLRVRTTATTRIVSLLTNALRASGNLAPIFRIAGDQAETELNLRRRRRQRMFTYLVVIYISFAVFLVIIVAVHEVLVPSLPTNVPTPSKEETQRLGVDAASFARFATVNKAAYTLVFFHTALLQATLSGFIAGQLGEGSLKDGAKHAAIMLGVAYVAFILLSSPVAQVAFADQTMTDDRVVVDSVSLSEGGFVVVTAGSPAGDVVGHSSYLEPGQHQQVSITLDGRYSGNAQLYAVPYRDTNGDEQFAAGGTDSADSPYLTDGEPTYDQATISRE
jgi:flagellar protein FlaJ